MPQAKLTIVRGSTTLKAVTVAAGTPIGAGSDAMELNIDQSKMSKGEAIIMIDKLKEKVHASPWPLG